MTWYTLDEAINHPELPKDCIESVIVNNNKIYSFINALIRESKKGAYIIGMDGFIGFNWGKFIPKIKGILEKENYNLRIIDISDSYKKSEKIEKMVRKSLTNDPNFGYVFEGSLFDFFDVDCLEKLKKEIKNYKNKNPTKNGAINVVICYGAGAAIPSLRHLYDTVFYFDITRESLVKRIEGKEVLPLATKKNTLSARLLMKRIYYVEYEILKKHKQYILEHIDWYVDGNNPDNLILLSQETYNRILSILAEYIFRLKPVYMVGCWGGQELKRIRKLPKEMLNCCFALDVIPQEQSIRILVGKTILEIPFPNLYINQPIKIMGKKSVKRFGLYFPITVNYADTCQGADQSIQVHGSDKYLREHFNERTRRDEIYYIVKTYEGAKTYHGLRDETDLNKFRQLTTRADKEKIPFDQNKYVNSWLSKPTDLYLIPNGTIHGLGRNCLMLEIDTDPSKTSAEYTFHFYDYLRPDLSGKLRGIHLKNSFALLKPYRRTSWVFRNLKPKPKLLRGGKDWAEYIVGKWRTMYYQVNRLEFKKRINDDTKGKFHLLILTEGDKVLVRSEKYPQRKFELKYTECVIVPASIGKYTITNLNNKFCHIIKTFIK